MVPEAASGGRVFEVPCAGGALARSLHALEKFRNLDIRAGHS